MKIRIKFAKQGPMKFVGHLDIMRYFQKAMRRAEVDICYSEGFSPHQIMSFAAPLGVGMTSNGEYLDIEVHSSDCSETMVKRLNDTMAEGIQVKSFKVLPDDAKTAMSLVAAADYTVEFRPDAIPSNWEAFEKDFMEFFSRSEILVTKKTKKGEKELDIKPLIYHLEIRDHQIQMQISTGSMANLRPEMVVMAFYDHISHELPPFALMLQREEVYADMGDENARKLCTLEQMGQDIE